MVEQFCYIVIEKASPTYNNNSNFKNIEDITMLPTKGRRKKMPISYGMVCKRGWGGQPPCLQPK